MKRARPLLGTLVEIEAGGLPETALQLAMDAAFLSMARVQALMSVHDRRSQLNRLNRHAWHRPLRVHPWLYQVLKMALKLHRTSHGLFDCTIAPTLMQNGLLPAHPMLSRLKVSLGQGSGRASSADIRLLNNHYVRFKRPLAIDLGGIAKGFAVDQAIACLKQRAVTAAVVNAGGDLRVYGAMPTCIHLRNPDQPAQLLSMGELQNGAMATSANYFMLRQSANKQTSAIIHPRSRAGLNSARSYSVFAPSCMLADGLTKVLALSMPHASSHRLLHQHRAQGFVL